MSSIRLIVNTIINDGVYFAGDVVLLEDGAAQELVRQGKAEVVGEVSVRAAEGPSTAATGIASAQDGADDE